MATIYSELTAHEQDFATNKKAPYSKDGEIKNNEYTFANDTLESGGNSVSVVTLTTDDSSNYYYETETTKSLVVLHYTAGRLKGDVGALTTDGNHVSVSYVVARDGTIYRLFDDKYWSYHLGSGAVGGNELNSKRGVGIEISNAGWLELRNETELWAFVNPDVAGSGKHYCNTTDTDAYVKLDTPFREKEYFATYTDAQYTSTRSLLKYLAAQHSIPYEFLDETKRYELFATNTEAKDFKGIASHINFRSSGKWDIGQAFKWEKLTEDAPADTPAAPPAAGPAPAPAAPPAAPVSNSTAFALPIDLGKGLAVTEENRDLFYEHTELSNHGGYYPLGTNTVWHGGVHLHANVGKAVHACADGVIVAARLPSDAMLANGEYGSRAFILVQHQAPPGGFEPQKPKTVTGYTISSPTLNLRQTPGSSNKPADDVIGQLIAGDQLEATGEPVQVDGGLWAPVVVSNAADPILTGAEGYVSAHERYVTPLYAGGPPAAGTPGLAYYSLYVHLSTQALEVGNAGLADIAWLRADGGVVTAFKTLVNKLPLREKPLESQTWFTTLAKGAELRVVDAPEQGGDGKYNWRFIEVASGDTANAGKRGWIPAQPEWVQSIANIMPNTALLDALRSGNIVKPADFVKAHVGAGDKLWTMGEYGSPDYRSAMIHWEIFSQDNLVPSWRQAVDSEDDFNMDCQQILGLVEQDFFGSDEVLTADEIDRFYSTNPSSKLLRQWACQFASEWGVDLDTAIDKLKGRWFTGHLKERIAPYLWWDEAAAAGVPLPAGKKVWHYNPIALMDIAGRVAPGGGGLPSGEDSGPADIHLSVTFWSQYESGHGFEPGDTSCFKAAKSMAEAAGATVADPSHRIQVGLSEDEDGKLSIDSAAAEQGRKYIDRELEAGRPVVVGVSHADKSYNVDKLTDHFVLITGRKRDTAGNTTYMYHDPASGSKGADTNSNNRFSIESGTGKMYRDGKIADGGVVSRRFEVAMVRRNEEALA
ncbi:N-acetylmuramoyl-L-alanine amidase [Phycisphaerae bacterium RAS1]|nr:N-acetylmuramoyl-L-alanine amidase [Phycisphaerae bacterium RAS1]